METNRYLFSLVLLVRYSKIRSAIAEDGLKNKGIDFRW
jgi:hypothetical protein